MKKLLVVGLVTLSSIVTFAQDQIKLEKQVVKASCGQCQFGLKNQQGCDLAIKIEDKAYFVDGSAMQEHGDAHAKEGMCNAIREAEVSGEVIDGRFKATHFKLIEVKEEK